jgi:hypothetical protein
MTAVDWHKCQQGMFRVVGKLVEHMRLT